MEVSKSSPSCITENVCGAMLKESKRIFSLVGMRRRRCTDCPRTDWQTQIDSNMKNSELLMNSESGPNYEDSAWTKVV